MLLSDDSEAGPQVPSFAAAFDLAVQPAATPYAAPRQPNVEEILTDEENCLLFSPDERRSLARALDRLVHDETPRNRLGHAARATIGLRGLTWDSHAKRIVTEAQKPLDHEFVASASMRLRTHD
jgi:glycosyltransferase involved in cell wall biosynthesis